MYNDLSELIAIDSTLGEPEPGAPFGRGPKAALDWFINKSRSYGLKTGQLDGKVAWAEYGDGDKIIGILGHLDIVPPGDGWTFPPFKMTIEDGKCYGRGVADDKGPAVACLHVLKKLKDENVKLNHRVRLIVGTNEENGSECMKHYRKHGELPEVSIVPDSDFPIINSEKGILTVKVCVPIDETFASSITSLCGGLRPNMVPADAAMTIKKNSPLFNCMIAANDGKLNSELFSKSPAVENIISAGFKPEDYTIEDIDGEIRIAAKGIAGHAMEPQKGENAVSKLFLLICAFKKSFASETAKLINEYLCSPLAAEKIGIAYEDKESGDLTFNLGTAKLDGGNLIFEINLRCPLCADVNIIPEKIRSVLPKGTISETASYSENLYIDENSPIVRTLLKVYADCTGEKPYTVQTGGGTYARELPNSVAFGPTFPGEETNIHNVDECMEIAHLDKLQEIYYKAVLALDKLPKV